MIYWAVEFYINPSRRCSRWHLDMNTIRRTRHEALQAPLDNGADWDSYTKDRRAGAVRAVKLRIERLPGAEGLKR